MNAKDRRGITALGVAVGFNRIPCVRCLLDAGADVHLTDARGSTVLHYAAGLSLCTADQLTPWLLCERGSLLLIAVGWVTC